MKVTIVSSSISETLPIDGKVIFLGSWCLAYSKKAATGLEHEIAEYHWDKPERYNQDIEFLDEIYNEYLEKITIILNQIHGTSYSRRYWQIQLGWWLNYFIQILFDRWKMASYAANKFPNAAVIRIRNEDFVMPAIDTPTFFEQSANDEFWNERLTSDIFEKFTKIGISFAEKKLPLTVASIKHNRRKNLVNYVSNLIQKSKESFVKLVFWLLRVLFSLLFHKKLNLISLESTYLNKINVLKLFFSLKATPKSFIPWEMKEFDTSNSLRNWRFPDNRNTEFAEVLEYFLPKHVPKCFLEGYRDNKLNSDQAIKQFLPQIIVTANDFAANDTWKFWASECVERGSKLIIAQHGGSYGVAAQLSTQDHEVAIADRFLSWGWKDNFESKIYPAPSMKLLGLKKRKPRRDGFCFLVTASLPRRSYHLGSWPIGPQLASYLNDQFDFVKNLSNAVRSNLAVRLFPHDFGWEQEQRWIDFDSDVNLLPLSKNLDKYLKETRLFISTYNATTFLESFKRNIPTVIYWDPNYWEINESSKPYFDLLKDANIFFDSPESAANHVNVIWEDVEGWWNSKKVKDAVKIFSETYAYTGTAPLEELRSAILNWD